MWIPKNPCSKECHKCILGNDATSVMVQSRGSDSPKILIVGEGPGKDEDKQGVAFVGRAGKLLDEIIEKSGIPLEDIRISNTCRCVPWIDTRKRKVRAPNQSEIQACIPFLYDEIRATNPKIIVSLGNTALEALTGKKQITFMRGKKIPITVMGEWGSRQGSQFICMPSFHPAYILRQEGGKQGELYTALLEDLIHAWKEAGGGMNMLEYPDSYRVFRDYSDFESYVHYIWDKYKKREIPGIVYDCETCGLDMVSSSNKILCISFSSQEGEGVVLPLEHKESPWDDLSKARAIELVRKLFSKVPVIGHNVAFDNGMVLMRYGIKVKSIYMDTMYGGYTLWDSSKSNKLEDVCANVLGLAGWKHETEGMLSSGVGFEDMPFDLVWKRCARDTEATYRLFRWMEKRLEEDKMVDYYYMYANSIITPALYMHLNGMKLDTLKLEEVNSFYTGSMEDIRKSLSKMKHVKIFEEKYKKQFEPHIPHHIQDLFFNILNLPVFERSAKTKQPSASSDVREKLIAMCNGIPMESLMDLKTYAREKSSILRDGDGNLLYDLEYIKDIVSKIDAYNKAAKIKSSFGLPLKSLVREDGLLHAYFKPHSASSSRWSCKNPNLQQLPRKDISKRAFIPRYDSWVFIAVDAKQAELRVACSAANEPNMIRAFNNGDDLHKLTATKIFKKSLEDVSDEERYLAKTLNFLTLYGGTAKRLSSEAKIPFDEAQVFIDMFWESYPNLKSYMDSILEEGTRTGMVYSPTGSRRQVPGLQSTREYERESAARAAMNTPIQAAASNLIESVLRELFNWMMRTNLESKIVAFVHDSIIVDCSPSEAFLIAWKLFDLMENWLLSVNSWLKVPILGDGVIGVNLLDSVSIKSCKREGSSIVSIVEGKSSIMEDVESRMKNSLFDTFDVDKEEKNGILRARSVFHIDRIQYAEISK